jgi:GTP-binding protein LepA
VTLTLERGEVTSTTRRTCPRQTTSRPIWEPWVKLSVVSPTQYIGALMELATDRRGAFGGMDYLDPERVLMTFEVPLAEVIVDFYDLLKSRTQGYASLDYEEIGYRQGELVKLDVLVAGEPVDAFADRPPRPRAGRGPGAGRPAARADPAPDVRGADPGGDRLERHRARDHPAMRKNVLAKCYGGDVTRKRKLLEKQKEGKARMKRIGRVEIPQEAFLAVLRSTEAS